MNIEKVIERLKKNGMDTQYVATKEDALNVVKNMIPVGATVGVGGSKTLAETGILDLVRNGDYVFLDRYAKGLTPEEKREVFSQSTKADVYLSSSNAITENGELYNVDGTGNRVSAIAYGPTSVIIVAGINKIVPDIPAAIRRVKTIAAPLNAKRLGCHTYCESAGSCMGLDGGMADGCRTADRICCHYLVSGQQRIPNRIKVILIGEPCGF